jgi:translation elongation factor EF-1alpha
MAQRLTKPSFTLTMLGAPEKATITEALLRRCGGREAPAANFGAKEHVFETPLRRYSIRDGAGQAGVQRGLLFGPSKPDAALLVLDAINGANAEIIEQLKLARQLSIASLLVVLLQTSQRSEDELDLAELTLRELLNEQGFPGDETPFFRGDISGVVHIIDTLLEKIDSLLPTAQNRFDDFLLLIDERFSRPNQDLIAAGRVLRGSVRVGDAVSLVSSDGFVNSRVSALDIAVRFQREDSIVAVGVIRERRERATTGQWISCHLSKPTQRELDDSYALTRPGSVTIYKEAKALVWIEHTTALDQTLLFRIRTEKGGFRRLIPEGSKLKLAAQKIQVLSLPTAGMSHLETPAYFEVMVPRLSRPVGCGVIVSLV